MQYESQRIGKAIRGLREQRCLSREEMSYQLNRSLSHVVQVELGKRKISMDMLYSLMDVLGVDANAILLFTESEKDSHLSIDAELATLSQENASYLTSVFHYMIAQIRMGGGKEVMT